MTVTIIRTLVVFFALMVLMRILGKRQRGEMELSELVVSVLMANLAAGPLEDTASPLFNSLIPIVILFACELIMSDLTMRSVRLRSAIAGRPCMLIRNGKILQDQMRACRFTVDELNEELRAHDIADISKVKYAILETDGTFNARLYASELPPTAADLGVAAQDLGYPYVIVEDGIVKGENLRLCGRDENWLSKELKRQGASGPEDVYLLIAYDSGEVYFAEKETRE